MVIFLNSFYKMFDSRLAKYDIFKVDTVNDAHMVASGVPEKNGDKHAPEIATMALDLLGTSAVMSIQHKPNERVQLRASIHSGSVVAGIQVVGSKMPRYRLFGDTVDVAAMMNTTGDGEIRLSNAYFIFINYFPAMKIHISLETKLLLDIHGCFKCEHRGAIDIKVIFLYNI